MTDTKPPALLELKTRTHIFATLVTWRFEGDHLVHEAGTAPSDLLPLAELQEVRVWRTIGARRFGIAVGGHMEARLRIAGRWWTMSGHHADGPGRIFDRSPALIEVLSAAVRRRLEIGDGLVCRVGSGVSMIGAVLVCSLVAVSIAAFAVGVAVRGIPSEKLWGVLVFAGLLFLLIRLAVSLARNGKRETLTAEDFLRHQLIAFPA